MSTAYFASNSKASAWHWSVAVVITMSFCNNIDALTALCMSSCDCLLVK